MDVDELNKYIFISKLVKILKTNLDEFVEKIDDKVIWIGWVRTFLAGKYDRTNILQIIVMTFKLLNDKDPKGGLNGGYI